MSPIAINCLSDQCNTTISSAKKTIQRLTHKGVISKIVSKNGRSGWSKYTLSDTIYNEIKHEQYRDKSKTNWRQTEGELETITKTKPETPHTSSSGLNNITTYTTNNTNTKKELSQEWLDLDIGIFLRILTNDLTFKNVV